MALHGGIDTLTHRRLVGWAWEGDAPDMPVALIVAIGSRVLGRVTADLHREDLAIEGVGLGRCGFELALPAHLLKPREGYAVAVRVEGSGLHLPGSLMRAYLAVIAVGNRVAAEISRRLVDELEAKGYDRQATKDRIRTMALRVRARLKATSEQAAAE